MHSVLTHIALYKLHTWDSHSLSINMYIFIYVLSTHIPTREICLFVIYFLCENCEEISSLFLHRSIFGSPPFKIEQMYASILWRGSHRMLSSEAPIGWHRDP